MHVVVRGERTLCCIAGCPDAQHSICFCRPDVQVHHPCEERAGACRRDVNACCVRPRDNHNRDAHSDRHALPDTHANPHAYADTYSDSNAHA